MGTDIRGIGMGMGRPRRQLTQAVLNAAHRLVRRVAVWRILVVALGVYAAAFVAFAVGPFDVDPDTRAVVSDLAFLLTGITVTLLAWHASRRAGISRPVRRAWVMLAIAFFAFWLGDVLYAYFDFVSGSVPDASIADIAYLAYYPFLLIGLVSFPRVLVSASQRVRFVLDSATVALGGGLVVWFFVLGPLAGEDLGDPLNTLLSLAYPVGDLVLLLGVAVVALRTPREVPRRAVALLLAGLLVSLAADVAYGSQTLTGRVEPGTWLDGLYMLAWFLLGASAYVAASDPPRSVPGHDEEVVQSALPLLPYVSVATGYGMLLLSVQESWTPRAAGLVIGAGGLTALVIARQVSTVRENMTLLAERVMRKGEARFRSLVQNASDIIVVVDANLAISYATPSVMRLLGYSPDELVRVDILDRIYPEDRSLGEQLFAGVVGHPGAMDTYELRLARRDGTPLIVETSVLNLMDDPDIRGHVITIRDVDARKRLEVKLAHQSSSDSLTGLPTGPMFAGATAKALDRAREEDHQIAVLYLDADDMTSINETFGHRIGDRALLEIGRRIRSCLRTVDLLARLGGDEFAILLDGDAAEDATTALGRHICAALAAPYIDGGVEIALRASIGICFSTADTDSSQDLLRRARLAMRLAKAAGKAQVTTFETEPERPRTQRADLGPALHDALANGELEVHYQPIVELSNGRTVGAEAGARWRHADGELETSSRMRALAEETGLSVAIGRWVIERACRDARRWPVRSLTDALFVAVRVSPRQLDDLEFPGDVAAILARTRIAPARLRLEIGELGTAPNEALVIERLRALTALGVQITLADIGSGESSVSYLRRMPLAMLKLDRSLTADLDRATGSALMRGLIELAHSFGYATLADGVDTAEQAATLAALGCDTGQGRRFGRAVAADQLIGDLAATAVA